MCGATRIEPTFATKFGIVTVPVNVGLALNTRLDEVVPVVPVDDAKY